MADEKLEWERVNQPTLFLDVDGVLNNYNMFGKYEHRIERGVCQPISDDAVAQLHRVIEATGCRVVLSSTWRHIPEALAGLRRWHGIRVVGITDTIPHTHEGRHFGSCRGKEILAYVSEFGLGDNWAVLDDESTDILLPGLVPPEKFVQTSGYKGLTQVEADRLIEILGEKSE